jgi:hypothetical protein
MAATVQCTSRPAREVFPVIKTVPDFFTVNQVIPIVARQLGECRWTKKGVQPHHFAQVPETGPLDILVPARIRTPPESLHEAVTD